MSHNVARRLRKLEGPRHGRPRPILVFGMSWADAKRQLAALRASGKYQDGDHVVHIRWMTESQAKARGWT